MQDVYRKNASPSTSLIKPSLAVHTLLWFSPPSLNIKIPYRRSRRSYYFLKMSEICPTCDSAVYSAEKAAISGKNGEVWHKQCLKCSNCNKRLDSMTFNEHKGQLYCKAHYSKEIGAKGYGFGQGAGTFQYTE